MTTAYINTARLGVKDMPALTLEAVPHRVLVTLSCRLYALCALTWEYVDTILDLCCRLRIPETKPLVRRIRELKREYDRFRAPVIDSRESEDETERGLLIEETLKTDFQKLFYSLYNDVSRLKLTEGHRQLVIAVQQAMTLLDAVSIYAGKCDMIIESYGVAPIRHCMLQEEFKALYPLIPQFAGDCYRADLSARRTTAGIIARKLDRFAIIVKN